jgi:beta-barrel assembly-enhancing protease
MKAPVFVLSALFAIGTASPAHAQLGGLGKLKKAADKAVDTKEKIDALNFTDAEERQLGEQVSLKLRSRFGVLQSEPTTKYVTLVGTALAQASTRPNLDWKFIVLDTDGVNAYAAPGGFIHITRGLLGLMKNEAQLAGVLGHEITHVTVKHTVRAIQKNKSFELGSDAVGGSGGLKTAVIAKVAGKVYDSIFEGEFSREDENEADKVGAQLANKVGYAPNGMVEVLKMIDARNGGREDRNGMFASHPATKDRIGKLEKQIADEKLAGKATAEARYKQNITFEAKPANEIAMDVEGAAGLASGDKKKDDDKKADEKKDEPKKKGFGLGSITGGKQSQAQQQTASAGARGGVPDRDAKGGPNKNPLGVKITAAELEAFKKGIGA